MVAKGPVALSIWQSSSPANRLRKHWAKLPWKAYAGLNQGSRADEAPHIENFPWQLSSCSTSQLYSCDRHNQSFYLHISSILFPPPRRLPAEGEGTDSPSPWRSRLLLAGDLPPPGLPFCWKLIASPGDLPSSPILHRPHPTVSFFCVLAKMHLRINSFYLFLI